MKWAFAEASIIARSLEKDEFYIGRLDGKLRNVFGTHRVYRWLRGRSRPYAALLYRLLTIGVGRQTLGEEYCQLLAVDTAHRSLPARWKRLLLVLLPVLAGSLVWEECLERLHRALFYLQGRYAEPLRRLLSLRYVYYPQRIPTAKKFDLLYAALGAVGLLVGGWQAYRQLLGPILRRHLGAADHGDHGVLGEGEAQETLTEANRQCPLCLEARRECTVAPCGHLFCWDCLLMWLRQRPECPLCRTFCMPAHLFCIIDPYAPA